MPDPSTPDPAPTTTPDPAGPTAPHAADKHSHRRRPSLRVSNTLDRTLDTAADSIQRVAEGMGLPVRFKRKKPGKPAGIEHSELAKMPVEPGKVWISCIDYSPDNVQVQEVTDLTAFISDHRPQWSQVRWINIDGLTDSRVIHALAVKYELHPLAIEDVLHIPQRPKVDSYGEQATVNGASQSTHNYTAPLSPAALNLPPLTQSAPAGKVAINLQAIDAAVAGLPIPHRARLFIICRMIEMIDNHLHSEQISIFLGHKTVLTFQETHGDVWDPIRQRINTRGSRLRQNDAGFLCYALIDAIVDSCFPILEYYGDRLEDLEDTILNRPTRDTFQEIHALKRELLLLRRALWPMREVVHSLQREPHECMSENTRTYLRDVYDHIVQIIDIIETYREVATGLTETYMTSMSHRLNETMKVLTVIGTIFIPLTFLAGVWGMNFEGMFETHSRWAYPWFYPIGFWALCITVSAGLLIWFKRRGWL